MTCNTSAKDSHRTTSTATASDWQSAEDSTSSAGAWLRWLDTLTAADRAGIETHQLLCEIGGLADCLHRAPDAAMIRDARRATAEALAH